MTLRRRAFGERRYHDLGDLEHMGGYDDAEHAPVRVARHARRQPATARVSRQRQDRPLRPDRCTRRYGRRSTARRALLCRVPA
jgi:hypothetical protein